MSRASDDILDELHGAVAQNLLDTIKRYKAGEITDAEGTALPIPPALFAQAIKMLKDNGIDRPVKPGDPEDLLGIELDQFEKEQETPWHSQH